MELLKGVGVPAAAPEELGGGGPRSLPLPPPGGLVLEPSGARVARARAGLAVVGGVRSPSGPPLCGGCRCGCSGSLATWAGPRASGAQRGPRPGLEPITPEAREARCLMAAREAVAALPCNLSSRR